MLSALKVSVEFATNYQAEIKYLEIELSFIVVVTSLLEIKSFLSLKNEYLLFWTRLDFKGEEGQVLQTFEGGCS